MKDSKGNELEIDTVYFSAPVDSIPSRRGAYAPNSGMTSLRNPSKYERLDLVVISGEAFLRRTLLENPEMQATIHLSNPLIRQILWRRAAKR